MGSEHLLFIFFCLLPAAMADSKVKDMGLAEFGRKELTLAEHEMPGLMAARKEYGPGQPFKGMNINGSLHMTDGGADRNSRGARRKSSLVFLQHLQHPRPRCCSHRQGRHLNRLCLEG